MTIASTLRRAGPYATNGVQTAFAFDFKVFDEADLRVVSVTGDVETDLTLTTDYTVDLNEDQDGSPGGTVNLLEAPDGPSINILSDMVIEQPVAITNRGGFFPRVFNDVFDRLTIYIQQLHETVSRAALLPLGEPTPGKFLVTTASNSFGFSDGTGNDAAFRADAAASDGADLIGYGARSVAQRLGDTISVKDEGATGGGVSNDAAAIQSAIDSAGAGGTVRFPRGRYLITTGIVVSEDDVALEFENGASVVYNTPTMTAVTLAGARGRIVGGRFEAPATFDGTNAAITYAVVKVTGEYVSIKGLHLENVPRVGILFSEAGNGMVTECVINGGTAEGFFTGINTVHFGIAIDPASTGSQGNFIISDNIIRRCVQGAGSGNTGAASFERAITVTGNVFEECWNHGWYSSGLAIGVNVTGNAFSDCQIPVALTGADHVVVGNTLTTQSTGTALDTDNEIVGISMRDPARCIVSGNVVKGEALNGGTVISFDDNSGVPGANEVKDNVCVGNIIHITNSAAGGVAAIRFVGNSSEVSNNVCANNTITAPVRLGDGLIEVIGSAASKNNHIRGNILRMTRAQAGYFVLASGASYTKIEGNTFELAADAGSATTIAAVGLVSCSYTSVESNHFICTSAWGTNITYRCVQEFTAGTRNAARDNTVHLDTTKLAVANLFVALNSSPFLLDHAGVGAPEGAVIAGPGSVWRRTDGAAGTTLYVKETGNSNTGWREMGKATAPTVTYAAPAGGATVDTEARAALEQLAVDLADVRTKLAAAKVTA